MSTEVTRPVSYWSIIAIIADFVGILGFITGIHSLPQLLQPHEQKPIEHLAQSGLPCVSSGALFLRQAAYAILFYSLVYVSFAQLQRFAPFQKQPAWLVIGVGFTLAGVGFSGLFAEAFWGDFTLAPSQPEEIRAAAAPMAFMFFGLLGNCALVVLAIVNQVVE